MHINTQESVFTWIKTQNVIYQVILVKIDFKLLSLLIQYESDIIDGLFVDFLL